MFAAFVGKMGSGKTCMMTYTLYRDHKERGRSIQANYRLHFPYHRLDLKRMLDATDRQIQNSSLGIDEAWLFFDARAAQRKVNRLISHVLLQSRKRDVDVYVTAQSFKQLDLRFRQNCDYVVLMAMRNDILFPRMFNRDTGKWTKMAIDAKPIFSLYDTNELIDPTILGDGPADDEEANLMDEIQELAQGARHPDPGTA